MGHLVKSKLIINGLQEQCIKNHNDTHIFTQPLYHRQNVIQGHNWINLIWIQNFPFLDWLPNQRLKKNKQFSILLNTHSWEEQKVLAQSGMTANNEQTAEYEKKKRGGNIKQDFPLDSRPSSFYNSCGRENLVLSLSHIGFMVCRYKTFVLYTN